jgi:uncharacterized membrane protein
VTPARALAVALLLVGGASAQEPEPAPNPSELLDGLLGGLLGFPERTGKELQAEVEKAGGVRFRRDVPVAFMGRAELDRFLRELFDTEYPPSRARVDERMLAAFDLVPPGTDLRAVRRKLLQENIVGFYDERPGRKQLYAVSEESRFGPTNQIILVHELRHALQDQHVDLRGTVADSVSDYDDRRLAWMSLVEGDATLVMERFLLGGVSAPEEGFDVSGLAVPDLAGGPGVPAVVNDQLVQPYFVGRELASAIWKRGGAQALREAWDRPPGSTEQVLHPAKYFAGERPAVVVAPKGPPGGTVIAEGVLGELLIRTLLEGDQEAAKGWGGDAYRLFDTGTGTLLAWRTAWDAPEEAREFRASLNARFSRLHGAPRARGSFSEYDAGAWRFAVGEEAGTVVFMSSDDPKALGVVLGEAVADAGTVGGAERAPGAEGASPAAGAFVDKPREGLDNAATVAVTAGSETAGERLAPRPQGGAMASSTPGASNLGMDPKIASLLCYVPCCLGFIFSVVAAIVEKTSRTVRFNAFQSLLLNGAGFVIMIALTVLQTVLAAVGLGAVSVLFWLLQVLVGVGLLVLSIILMVKANSGQEMVLPVIGEMAKKWA